MTPWGRWAEWNGKFRDCVRRFVKSDADAGPELLWRLQGSPDMYGNRSAEASINFVTCHDGFSLWDMVSYNEKHNEQNGEDNRDGANDNNSWNCGVEGETTDSEILALRNRQVKNVAAMMLLSRGIPMMLSGDEYCNTQFGNNNAYSQDNAISWLDWENYKKHPDVFTYFKRLIAFRKAHPVLRRTDFFTGQNSSGYPEVSFHGVRPWELDTNQPFLTFGVMYVEPAADYQTKEDCFIYCAINAYWESQSMELPIIPEGKSWYIYAYSADSNITDEVHVDGNQVWLDARSSMVLVAH